MGRMEARLRQYQREDLQFGLGAVILICIQFITPALPRIILLLILLSFSISFNYRSTAMIGKKIYFLFLFGGFVNLVLLTMIPSQLVSIGMFGPNIEGGAVRVILAAIDLVWAHLVVTAGRNTISIYDNQVIQNKNRLDMIEIISRRAAEIGE
ncbi:MAG TPA: hypothetical protein VFS21_09145 [Roseiflexaceae bacterium]|nr:hypothetical protein [Roseiflexaceae bacterium]